YLHTTNSNKTTEPLMVKGNEEQQAHINTVKQNIDLGNAWDRANSQLLIFVPLIVIKTFPEVVEYVCLACVMAEISLQSIWEAIHQMKEQVSAKVNAHLDLKIGTVQAGLMDIQQTLNSVVFQITELQQRVSTNEDNVAKLLGRVNALEKDNTYLKEKVEDSENRSRRPNLRFISVPEKSEGGDIVAFMSQQLIPKLLRRESFPKAPVVERAHGSPTFNTSVRLGASRPRPILVKFLSFQDKVKIMRLAKEKGDLVFEGNAIHIYPDFSLGIVKKRHKYDAVKRKLPAADIKYSLLYPYTLRVMVKGKPKLFRSSKEAEDFFQDLSPGSTTVANWRKEATYSSEKLQRFFFSLII
uniref:L1 transposable element RRM domain-containing protein n=1 Tax=Sphaeramia orbicularis TaxID=375764 RepID=A0A672Z1F5_9TELE